MKTKKELIKNLRKNWSKVQELIKMKCAVDGCKRTILCGDKMIKLSGINPEITLCEKHFKEIKKEIEK